MVRPFAWPEENWARASARGTLGGVIAYSGCRPFWTESGGSGAWMATTKQRRVFREFQKMSRSLCVQSSARSRGGAADTMSVNAAVFATAPWDIRSPAPGGARGRHPLT